MTAVQQKFEQLSTDTKKEIANTEPITESKPITMTEPINESKSVTKIKSTPADKIGLWLVDYDSTDITAFTGVDKLSADDMVCIYCSKPFTENLPELKKIANTKASVTIYITGTTNTASTLEISSRLSSDILTKHDSKYRYHIVTNNKSYNSLINVLRLNSNIDINIVQNLNGTQISEINTSKIEPNNTLTYSKALGFSTPTGSKTINVGNGKTIQINTNIPTKISLNIAKA